MWFGWSVRTLLLPLEGGAQPLLTGENITVFVTAYTVKYNVTLALSHPLVTYHG